MLIYTEFGDRPLILRDTGIDHTEWLVSMKQGQMFLVPRAIKRGNPERAEALAVELAKAARDLD